jgi:hypothetical protein
MPVRYGVNIGYRTKVILRFLQKCTLNLGSYKPEDRVLDPPGPGTFCPR